MGWGTEFKAEIYLSRLSISDINGVNNHIEESDDLIKSLEQDICILVSMSHKEETLEDIIWSVKNKLNDFIESYKEEIINNYKLNLLKNCLADGGVVNID